MPLDSDTRKYVIEYVLRDVVPKTVHPRPPVPMEWFVQQFAFIPDTPLRQHLGEAFYQARYIGRVREALDLHAGFNNAFTKYQILLYASIFEAIIDYLLEHSSGHPVVENLLTETVLKKQANALSTKLKMTFEDAGVEFDLIPCREVTRPRKLREVQFDQRVDAAVQLGIVPVADERFIKTLYKSRNNIHLQSSATKDFQPDDQESSEAFRLMFSFTKHLAGWVTKHPIIISADAPTG